jgi:hypothetical protein
MDSHQSVIAEWKSRGSLLAAEHLVESVPVKSGAATEAPQTERVVLQEYPFRYYATR